MNEMNAPAAVSWIAGIEKKIWEFQRLLDGKY
jgi:hypothetical protein